jgi:hypothetical protein
MPATINRSCASMPKSRQPMSRPSLSACRCCRGGAPRPESPGRCAPVPVARAAEDQCGQVAREFDATTPPLGLRTQARQAVDVGLLGG